MTRGIRRERRAGYNRLKWRRAHFLQLPPILSLPLLLMAWGLAIVGDVLTPPTLWFGPVYLLVIGYAAWMLGRISAVVLGIAVMTVNFLLGTASQFPYEPNSSLLNLSIKATAVIGVVLLLGNARKALEREWTLA